MRGGAFTGERPSAGSPPGGPHRRALRKQGIRLIESRLQRDLLALVPEVFEAAEDQLADKETSLAGLHQLATDRGLEHTLTDLRKIWSLCFKARVLERHDGGCWSLRPEQRTAGGLRHAIAEVLHQRLQTELGDDYDPEIADRLAGLG